MIETHRPDRLGLMVIAFAVFVLYIGVANWLSLVGRASLPLATIDPFPLLLLDLVILTLFLIRQRSRAQNTHIQQ